MQRDDEVVPWIDSVIMGGVSSIMDGRPVFVLAGGKRPVANCARCAGVGDDHDRDACKCLMCHGFYAATLDTERFRQMLNAVPDSYFVAIRTGAPSGLVVIDIDPRHGGHVDPDLMPPTESVTTASGGYHLYYRHPGVHVPNSQSLIAPGVDVRGDGGYVVAAGSRHPTTGRLYLIGPKRPIVEMPRPLLDACLPKPAAATSPRPTTTTPGGGISDPDALLRAHLSAVASAPVGKRRGALYGASRGVGRMVRPVRSRALTPSQH